MGFFACVFYLLIAVVSLGYYYFKQRLSYWKRRGIPHDEPNFPAGNLKEHPKLKHMRDITSENYHKYKGTGPFGGFFFFLSPAVILYDLDLIRDVLIKDFNNFTDRGMFHNEKDDPLTANLLGLDGAKWRQLRNKLSPTFTSGRMKFMFPTVVSVGEKLLQKFDQMAQEDSIIEMKDILARFTVDVIGTCAFGIDCNSLNDPNAEFRRMGANASTLKRHSKMVNGFIFSFPKLARQLRMRQIHDDIHEFFIRVVRETVEYRKKNSVERNDFLNLLIELKNDGAGLSIEEMAAQTFMFFLAGFETSSTTIGFTLFELALNQDIQNKLRDEINTCIEKNNGVFSYDAMISMTYMEKVVKETLRKYPLVTNLVRRAIEDYPTSNPKYTIPKGTMVFIPADAIHHDPEIYPDPDRYDPERFDADEIQSRHPLTWLPFGDGPRHCIGLRFGKMQTYIGLVTLLRNYRFHYCDKTPNPLTFNKKHTLLCSEGGIYLRVERL
ncbi:probable cytochrome P450 6a20 [Episyrphus balteatus]|uniref:probable cytochrome P450 6a20 n=1 Tax=Episyrphus balteatus TaxID=286459 RepID=UPI002486B2B6|nr:probable cytochrome P450 6a20 [Episyrphus balteatus]